MPTLTRYIPVRRVTGNDALSALITTSTITREIADLLQFTPAKAAASILLGIFETIKNVQTNRQDCQRLARRCLSLLVDMRDQFQSHDESTPPSLLRAVSKFEKTLESIYEFMKQEADQKWGSRLMRKSTIEAALSDYNTALDDAVRAFQIATLVNIHLAVGDATSSHKNSNKHELSITLPRSEPSTTATLPPYSSPADRGADAFISDVTDLSMSPVRRSATAAALDLELTNLGSFSTSHQRDSSFDLIDLSSPASAAFHSVAGIASITLQVTPEEEEDEFIEVTDHHGFNRYHQSQVRLKGNSRTIKEGWWAGAIEGEVGGQRSLMLRYEGERKKAMRRWVRDVKLLQNVFHPNLPQMVGYSNDENPTPFILLANVQTRLPQALLLDSLKNASLARCAQLMLRFYRDTLDAALYLQQQLDLSDSKIQDYVENASYRIDAEETVVMGLPPPEIDNVVSWRNYGLAHSIRDVFLKILPNSGLPPKQPVDSKADGAADMQRKVNHLTVLARGLLPNSDNISTIHEHLHQLLGSLDEDEELSDIPLMNLRQIRKAVIATNTHQQAWYENNGITPHRFSVGDLGYLPNGENTGEQNWDNFVILCNVLQEGLATLEVTTVTEGKQGGWRNSTNRWDDLPTYELPGGIHGWTVVVPPESEFSIHITHTNEFVRVNDAWNVLLNIGQTIAETHGVKPEELILVTRAGTDQRFRVRDLRRIQYWPASIAGPSHGVHGFQPHPHQHFQHSRMGFSGQSGHHSFGGGGESRRLVPGQDLAPKVFYLFTSGDKEHEPYFSQMPIPVPQSKGAKPPELNPNEVKCFALVDTTYGFLNYVQLHAEDFAD